MSAPSTKRILVTGATGKVGRAAIARLLEHRAAVDEAMAGVTHVLHLATCKETPESIMDVTVKGLFWLLEAARTSPTFQQFILIGGDEYVGAEHADAYVKQGAVAEMQDAEGRPLLRNFVHLDDLVSAILLACDQPRARRQTSDDPRVVWYPG